MNSLQHHGPPRTPPAGRGGRGPSTPTAIHQNSGVPHGHVPAYLPGSASLVEELDHEILIVLRDGKHLIGTLSSYDQYSNLVLQNTVERRMVSQSGTTYYADIELGLYVVRGDSTVLMGKVHDHVGAMKQVKVEELEDLREAADVPLNWDFDGDLIA